MIRIPRAHQPRATHDTTAEVGEMDGKGDFSRFSIVELKTDLRDNLDRLNVGDLWSGVAEFRVGDPDPEARAAFEAGEPNFSQFCRPLTNMEVASRLTNILKGRKMANDLDIPKDIELNIRDAASSNFLTVDSYPGTTKTVPTHFLERWCGSLHETEGAEKVLIKVPGAASEKVILLDRKGRRTRKKRLVLSGGNGPLSGTLNGPEEEGLEESSKRKWVSIDVEHKLHALEVVQLCNLAPQTVREAKNLIPSLARLPHSVIWHYVDQVERFCKTNAEDEFEDANLERRALMNARAQASGLGVPGMGVDMNARVLKKRKLGVAKHYEETETTKVAMRHPRLPLGQELAYRQQITQHLGQDEVGNRRAAYEKKLSF